MTDGPDKPVEIPAVQRKMADEPAARRETGKSGMVTDLTEDCGIEAILLWAGAQQEAEEMGKTEFSCPLCGGRAWWKRAEGNHHLHAGCEGCGFRVVQ